MKNESKPLKTNISVTKRVFSFLIVVLILASTFVFATNDVYIMPHGISTLIGTINGGECNISPITADSEFAAFATSSGQCYILSNYASSYFYQASGGSLIQRLCNIGYSDIYYNQQITSLVPNTDTVTIVSDLDEAVSLFKNALNPNPPSPGYPLNYTLPAGNIAYLEIDTALFNGVILATIMPELSGVGSGDPWSLSSQFYTMSDDMLTNGASVYDLNGTRIVWNKSPNAPTNLLGQTDHAVWESEGPYPDKTYFVICNPFYFFDNENNSSITIVANGIKNVYVQPLKTVVQQNGNEISYNTTVDGGTYEGEVTDDLGPIEWTDPDGGNTAPGTSTSNTPVTGINQFQQWLQGILQQIISVFEPAHDAITTLASAVQNFSGWLKALYIWLPSPVLNLMTSAISLAIIIGVIKVFI